VWSKNTWARECFARKRAGHGKLYKRSHDESVERAKKSLAQVTLRQFDEFLSLRKETKSSGFLSEFAYWPVQKYLVGGKINVFSRYYKISSSMDSDALLSEYIWSTSMKKGSSLNRENPWNYLVGDAGFEPATSSV
jgi:hypothetical protein